MEERTYITYKYAIENIAYAMGVLQVFKDEEPMEKAAATVAYNHLDRVMQALQDGGIVDEE